MGLSDTFHSCLPRLGLWTACHLPFLKKLVLILQSLRPSILGYTYSRDADIRDLSQIATTTWERRTCQGEWPAQFQGSRKHSSSTCSPWLEINGRSMSMKLKRSVIFSSPWNRSIQHCDNVSDVILTHKLQLSVISSLYRSCSLYRVLRWKSYSLLYTVWLHPWYRMYKYHKVSWDW